MGSYHGTYVGSPTLGVAGALSGDANTAVTLNGTTQYVTAPGHATTPDVTLSCWVKRSAAAVQYLVFVGSAPNVARAALSWRNTGVVQFVTEGAATLTTATGPASDGSWHHIVCTGSDGVAGSGRIYVDGALAASGGTPHLSYAGPVVSLGAYPNATAMLAGTLDEVAIWSRVLTAAEVAALYRVGRSTWNRSGRPETDPTPTNAAKHARYG